MSCEIQYTTDMRLLLRKIWTFWQSGGYQWQLKARVTNLGMECYKIVWKNSYFKHHNHPFCIGNELGESSCLFPFLMSLSFFWATTCLCHSSITPNILVVVVLNPNNWIDKNEYWIQQSSWMAVTWPYQRYEDCYCERLGLSNIVEGYRKIEGKSDEFRNGILQDYLKE